MMMMMMMMTTLTYGEEEADCAVCGRWKQECLEKNEGAPEKDPEYTTHCERVHYECMLNCTEVLKRAGNWDFELPWW